LQILLSAFCGGVMRGVGAGAAAWARVDLRKA